ncbi:MAG: NYN domain-containing protein [Treponema sp.]|nr:NYN domain-containing protein [Treponema sp.]
MDKKILDVLRIGIFYDGYYFYKISNYYKYEHDRKARISISGLHEFIRNEIANFVGMDKRRCQIIDSHYFKGRSLAKDVGEKVQSERVFEDILMRENIVSHYLPLRFAGEGNVGQEKGIDVWLALEAYELAIYKHFDILVLIAGDGDYVPLVRKLHTLGTQVMLVCWDFSYHNESGHMVETKTSRQLLSEVFFHVQMHQKIEQNDNEYIKDLFVPEKPQEYIFNFSPSAESSPAISEKYTEPAVKAAEEFISTIFSINPNGYGFIKDDVKNNIFFHYSRLTNCDFAELKQGMKVRYTVEEDAERSKREEMPCYRATKVTLVE